jgi:hypothetical protein
MGDLANQVVVSIRPLQGFARPSRRRGHLFVFSQENTRVWVFDVSDPLTPAKSDSTRSRPTGACRSFHDRRDRSTPPAGMPLSRLSIVIALDISDPAHPAEISRSNCLTWQIYQVVWRAIRLPSVA